MAKQNHFFASALLGSLILAGCGSTPLAPGQRSDNSDFALRAEALNKKQAELSRQQRALAQQRDNIQQRVVELNEREAQLKEVARQATTPSQNVSARQSGNDEDLLPPNARPGECYARVYSPPKYRVIKEQVLKSAQTASLSIIPAKFEPVTEQVLVRAESKKIEVVPATFKEVTERVLVKPASTKLVKMPAKYEQQSERVMVKAAYTTWKKGTGPIQRVDQATGEIMCLVEVPAVYKTISKTVEVSPAQTRQVSVPAVYKTVKKRVVSTPTFTREIVIPAQYQTVQVSKPIEPAREIATPIEAVYQTVERRELMTPGGLEWRSILCDTNMTEDRLKDIQRALATAGFDPGPIDGKVQRRTMAAVNAYQRAKGLPVDQHLNIETVRSLGVLPN